MKKTELLDLREFVGDKKETKSEKGIGNYELCEDEPAYAIGLNSQELKKDFFWGNINFTEEDGNRIGVSCSISNFLKQEHPFLAGRNQKLERHFFQIGKNEGDYLFVFVLDGKVRNALINFFPSMDCNEKWQRLDFTKPFDLAFKSLFEKCALGKREMISDYRKELKNLEQNHKYNLRRFNDFISLFKEGGSK